MKRSLFAILSALSLLLFVAVAVLWVWSYWCVESVSRVRSGIMDRILSSHGRIILSRVDGQGGEGWHYRRHAPTPPAGPESVMPDPHLRGGEFGGFSLYYYGPQVHWTTDKSVAVPYWFVAVLTAIHPARLFIRRHWCHRRGARGLCPSCGYDLRATPGRCPECGLVPAAPPPTPTSRGNVQ